MKSAIIVHGTCDAHEYLEMDFPSPSNAHWLPWLQQKFLRAGVLCQCPEMPTPYAPEYAAWRAVFDRIAGGAFGCRRAQRGMRVYVKVVARKSKCPVG